MCACKYVRARACVCVSLILWCAYVYTRMRVWVRVPTATHVLVVCARVQEV